MRRPRQGEGRWLEGGAGEAVGGSGDGRGGEELVGDDGVFGGGDVRFWGGLKMLK